MPRLKVLSGKDVIRILAKFGFSVFAQRGSHVKLRREVHGRAQTLTIPNHDELDRGTLRAILTQACMYIPEDELRQHFYTE